MDWAPSLASATGSRSPSMPAFSFRPVVVLLALGAVTPACSEAPTSGDGGAVDVTITSDGSFALGRVVRLVLRVDGDGTSVRTSDVPLGAGFGPAGIKVPYTPEAGSDVLVFS